jgi:hypothetical protein
VEARGAIVGASDQRVTPSTGVDFGGEGAGVDQTDTLHPTVEQPIDQLVGDGGDGQDIKHG